VLQARARDLARDEVIEGLVGVRQPAAVYALDGDHTPSRAIGNARVVRGVGHAERREDAFAQVVLVGSVAEARHQRSQQLVRQGGVRHTLPRAEE